jgi:nucleotide-binding universal stress UspA family protein
MIAKKLGTRLLAVHAVEPGILPEKYVFEKVERARAFLERELADSAACDGIDREIDIPLGKPEEAIVERAAALGARLVVVGTSRDNSLNAVLWGTRAEHVLRAAPCPVLLVKRRPRELYRNVVVALDLEAASRYALEFALRTLPAAKFTILHAGAGSQRIAERDAANIVEDVVAARCIATGHPLPEAKGGPDIVFLADSPAKALYDEIVQLDADLAVLGTHGRTGMPRLFIGSVAQALSETLPCDILISRTPSIQDEKQSP